MSTMSSWVTRVADELGLGDDPDVTLILQVAADAAHGVARPAAPVTTYLLGVAVGRGADPAEAADRIRALVPQQPVEDASG
jgi:hypothetical protein